MRPTVRVTGGAGRLLRRVQPLARVVPVRRVEPRPRGEQLGEGRGVTAQSPGVPVNGDPHFEIVLPHAITASRGFLASVEAGLNAISELPALIVWADADFAFRDKERQRWEAVLPNHTTVQLHGAGHYLQSDAPHEFVDALRTWLARDSRPFRRPIA